ncbi:MAG: alginate export family protein [Phycisphaerae bacterium]
MAFCLALWPVAAWSQQRGTEPIHDRSDTGTTAAARTADHGVYAGRDAGDSATGDEPTSDTPPSPEPAAAAPRGPKYLNLRYDEDFSYLDGPAGSYAADLFDPIKNIHVDDDWRLSIGGEFRVRMESSTNIGFGANRRTNDTFETYRYLVHFDFRYRDTLRIFLQGIEAHDEQRDLPFRAIDENRWDVQQAFVDVKVLGAASPVTLRVGRQELQYGNERFVSPLDWASTRRRFDAVKLFAKGDPWDVAMWYAKPVVVERREGDDWDRNVDFYGLYTTYTGIPRHGVDAYFFAIDDKGNRRNPNGRRGDRSIFTLGTRFWGKTGAWDYETELAGQWGRWAGDTVQAWSVAIDAGRTFAACPWRPRVGAGFDYASGDDRSGNGKVGTFDQLFPLGHKYFGFLDLVARENIIAANVNVTVWPIPNKVQGRIAYHSFWLDAPDDALYNAAGKPTRRDPLGRSGAQVGQELDVTLKWKLDRHAALLLGWSHLFADNFIAHTGPSKDADLFYVQYGFKF